MSKIDEKYFAEFVTATANFLNTQGYKVQVYECDTAVYNYDGTPILFHGVKL